MIIVDSVVKGINAIVSIIKLTYTTIINLINGLISLFTWIAKIIDYAIELEGYFPSWISGFILLSIGISAIFLIVGRTGGHS